MAQSRHAVATTRELRCVAYAHQVYELMVPLDKPEVLEKTLDVLAQFATAIRYAKLDIFLCSAM